MEKEKAKTVQWQSHSLISLRHLDPEIPLDHFLMGIWNYCAYFQLVDMSLFNRIWPDPGFVSPVRSDPGFLSPIRSDPIRSDPVRSRFCQRPTLAHLHNSRFILWTLDHSMYSYFTIRPVREALFWSLFITWNSLKQPLTLPSNTCTCFVKSNSNKFTMGQTNHDQWKDLSLCGAFCKIEHSIN